MLYCFVEEDISVERAGGQFHLQAAYAKQISRYISCNLTTCSIKNAQSSNETQVFLRASYDKMVDAASLLKKHGFVLLENTKDIDCVEHWDVLPICRRQIYAVTIAQILQNSLPEQTIRFLRSTPEIFLKSRKKGFHAHILSDRILNPDIELIRFFEDRLSRGENELMMSLWYDIKRDSLGKRESRHFVFGGRVMNESRMLHSVRHTVPLSHRNKAAETASLISAIPDFPEKYVMDIAEFTHGELTFLDVVELNPITCAQCYVNNSIFSETTPDVAELQKRLRFGAEYCYDMLSHPERYVTQRRSSDHYEYSADCFYEFV